MSYITVIRHLAVVTVISSFFLCSFGQVFAEAKSLDSSTDRDVRAVVVQLEEAFNSVSIKQLQDILLANKENDEWVDDMREIERENGSVKADLEIERVYRKDQHLVAETVTTFVVNGKPETRNARILYFFTSTEAGLKLEKTEHPAMEKSNKLIEEAMRLGQQLVTAVNNKDYAAVSSLIHLTDDEAKGIREGDVEVFKKLEIGWLHKVINDPSLTLKTRGASRVNTPHTAKATVQILGKDGQILSSKSLTAKWFTQAESEQDVCRFSL